MRDAAIRKHDVLFEDVVDGLAVDDGAGAARVVGHHAAQRGAAGGREVGREAQAERSEFRVQIIKHQARLDPCPAFFRVDLEQTIEVLRRVEDQAGSNGLSGLRRAAATRGNRDLMAACNLDRPYHVVARARNHDAERLDLIDAGISRVESARDPIEPYLAGDGGAQVAFQKQRAAGGAVAARALRV